MATTTLTYDIDLRADPDRVWHALTDAATVPRWRFGMSFETDWRPGTRLSSQSPAGVGTVLAAAAGQRLVYEWEQLDAPEANGGRRSTVSYELTPVGDATHLHVEHSDLEPEDDFCRIVSEGWPVLLSTLKDLVEAG